MAPLLHVVFPHQNPVKTEPKSPVLSSPDAVEQQKVVPNPNPEGENFDLLSGPVKKEVMFSEQDLIPTGIS
jgi:hypothetical protein